jgi:SAM-dependent methyltransferase
MSGNPELMLKTVLSVLGRQWEYTRANKNYKKAYQAGIGSWQALYGQALVTQIQQLRTQGEKGRVRQLMKTLVRYAPGYAASYAYWKIAETGIYLAKAVLPLPVYRHLVKWRGLDYSPPIGRLRFGDLRRLTPISRHFGYERGGPVDRYYIEKFLERHAADVRGRVLEIGDDSYTRRFGGDHVTVRDVLHVEEGNPVATFVGDLAAADHIPSAAFDCIILTQTLHLIYDVRAAIRTVGRILKPGGVVLATVPGISQISADEWAESWHWAFTIRAVQKLFAEIFPAQNIQVEAHGNVLAAISFLHGLAVTELRQEELDHTDPHYQLLITIRAIAPEAA